MVCWSLFSLSPHISVSAENFPSSSPSSTATDVHASPTASLALPDCEPVAASISLVALRNFSPVQDQEEHYLLLHHCPVLNGYSTAEVHVGTVYISVYFSILLHTSVFFHILLYTSTHDSQTKKKKKKKNGGGLGCLMSF